MKKIKCSRCNKKLIAGKNIPKDWHVPICKECRIKTMNKNNFDLTKEEIKIMRDRLNKDLRR